MDVTGNFDGEVTLADLEDPDKLAVVMGHEIGHAMAHHGAKRMSQSQLAQLGMAAVSVGVGDMDPGQRQLVLGAMGVAAQGGITLHVEALSGVNSHHIVEAVFKAVARALREAVEPDPRKGDAIPSTKGAL